MDKPIVNKELIRVPNGPGLGIRLNEEAVKAHMDRSGCLEPTPEWDNERAMDNLYT